MAWRELDKVAGLFGVHIEHERIRVFETVWPDTMFINEHHWRRYIETRGNSEKELNLDANGNARH